MYLSILPQEIVQEIFSFWPLYHNPNNANVARIIKNTYDIYKLKTNEFFPGCECPYNDFYFYEFSHDDYLIYDWQKIFTKNIYKSLLIQHKNNTLVDWRYPLFNALNDSITWWNTPNV